MRVIFDMRAMSNTRVAEDGVPEEGVPGKLGNQMWVRLEVVEGYVHMGSIVDDVNDGASLMIV